jgi:hypothetical protein
MAANDETKLELLRLSVGECFVYKIPPFVPASGHVADSWGLDKPLITGSLKIVQGDDDVLFIRIFAQASGSDDNSEAAPLFCECPVSLAGEGAKLSSVVDAVVDSSRCESLNDMSSTGSCSDAVSASHV